MTNNNDVIIILERHFLSNSLFYVGANLWVSYLFPKIRHKHNSTLKCTVYVENINQKKNMPVVSLNSEGTCLVVMCLFPPKLSLR